PPIRLDVPDEGNQRRDLPGVLDPPRTLEAPIGPATNHQHIEFPHIDTECHAQALLSAGDLLPVHVVDAGRTVGSATHGDDLRQAVARRHQFRLRRLLRHPPFFFYSQWFGDTTVSSHSSSPPA